MYQDSYQISVKVLWLTVWCVQPWNLASVLYVSLANVGHLYRLICSKWCLAQLVEHCVRRAKVMDLNTGSVFIETTLTMPQKMLSPKYWSTSWSGLYIYRFLRGFSGPNGCTDSVYRGHEEHFPENGWCKCETKLMLCFLSFVTHRAVFVNAASRSNLPVLRFPRMVIWTIFTF